MAPASAMFDQFTAPAGIGTKDALAIVLSVLFGELAVDEMGPLAVERQLLLPAMMDW